MCGDLEGDDSQSEEEFYSRFVTHAHTFLAGMTSEGPGGKAGPLFDHLNSLFRDMLAAATDPGKAPKDVSGYDRLSMEPLVFARLAGFIAAHQPLEEDPLRRLLEALMMGYAEGETVLPDHGHGHGHS